ncbi:SdrH family protein, partial [Staphylococcus nepalensis]|uniref:SdrH family protein n=2 Tax=Staphylococcus TaxID=1279 RepID=UPI0025A5E9A0
TNEGADDSNNSEQPNNGGGGTPTNPDNSNGEGTTNPNGVGNTNEGAGNSTSSGQSSNSNNLNNPSKPNNEDDKGDIGDNYQRIQPNRPSNPSRPNVQRSVENEKSNGQQNNITQRSHSNNQHSELNYGNLPANESTKQASSNINNEHQILNRFSQMSTGSFKYNPFVVNQAKQLNDNQDDVSNKEILSMLRPHKFDDNSFLNELQKGTNYFKFQYFNPLKSQDYYQNLDNQVLALITGEIGSMPDLKNPKTKNASGKYEYHSSSDEEITETTKRDAQNTIDIKFERTLFALITAIIVIFVGVLVGYFVHRKNSKIK